LGKIIFSGGMYEPF